MSWWQFFKNDWREDKIILAENRNNVAILLAIVLALMLINELGPRYLASFFGTPLVVIEGVRYLNVQLFLLAIQVILIAVLIMRIGPIAIAQWRRWSKQRNERLGKHFK